MRPTRLVPLSPLLLLACLGPAVQAQTAPPIKPGLWQVQSERLVNGQKAPDPSQRMKDMPPEVRARLEAAMKERGVDASMGAGGAMKICLSRESLDQGQWQGQQQRCKTDFGTRSASSWKWHSVCTEPASETDGEAIFATPESYSVKTSTTMAIKGQTRTSQMTINAKWLGADCGTLKPVTAPAKP